MKRMICIGELIFHGNGSSINLGKLYISVEITCPADSNLKTSAAETVKPSSTAHASLYRFRMGETES